MKIQEFNRIAIELFGSLLEPLGYTHEGSNGCTFHKRVSDTIFHMVIPDIASRGAWYDVNVAPVSPVLDPEFYSKFPDYNFFCTSHFLNKWDGVSERQQQFNCKYEENFRHGFERDVHPLLKEKGVPFLDGVRNLEDLLPLLRSELHRGLTLFHIGRISDAKPILEREIARLSNLDMAKPIVAHIKILVAK